MSEREGHFITAAPQFTFPTVNTSLNSLILSGSTVNSPIDNQGTLTVTGSTLNAPVDNQGTFTMTGSTINAPVDNQGTLVAEAERTLGSRFAFFANEQLNISETERNHNIFQRSFLDHAAQ